MSFIALDDHRDAENDLHVERPNQSLQPTASRRTTSFYMTKTFQPAAARAAARRGWALAR